jgi:hypothetical protein
MPVTFNPFVPWLPLITPSAPAPARGGKRPKLEVSSSDPGLKLIADPKKGTVTFTGVARGDKPARDVMGYGVGSYARGVNLAIGLDEVKTVDVFGRTDYTQKNRRGQVVITQKGWTAAEVARRMADKFNAEDSFRCTVKASADGKTATVQIERR